MKKGSFDHPYPTTKIMFIPDRTACKKDLLATTGDYLRIWDIPEDGGDPTMKVLLNNNKNSEYCAPLTSFDWNESNPNRLVTSSIDTTCTYIGLCVSIIVYTRIHPLCTCIAVHTPVYTR